ncbi:MAG: hypothetical protein JOZ05_02740 [Acetobacteraceae bacterium]|nr:hypothetical protein [Acetobacteraceae bacterium]
MSEAALYPAVKRFLQGRGFEVKGEVAGCDVVGVKAGEPTLLVITELKLGLSFDLVLQGVDRMACADEVWLAVKATRRGRDRDRRARKLCRLLGFGLLAVHPPQHVEVVAEPAPYRPRQNVRWRKRVLGEHEARAGDPSPGGTGGVPIMTAYRQEALLCATRMQAGPQRPRDLRPDAPRAASILKRNVYGWFERVDRGLYGLTSLGEEALSRWR